MLNDLRYRMRALLRRGRADRELDDELRFHLERLADSYAARGISRDDALRRARLEFGGVERIKDDTRDAWGIATIESTIQDLRQAAHRVVRRPIVASVVIVSLACGIGANVAIFSVIDAALLKRLPVPEPPQLVTFATQFPGEARPRPTFAYATFEKFRDELPQLSGAAAVWLIERSNLTIATRDDHPARPYRVALVSGNYFATLRVRPSVGRVFTSDDDRVAGGHPVVVISHELWRRAFALAPDVVGRPIIVAGSPYTIVGVANNEFTGEWVGRPADLWIPLAMQSQVAPDQPGLLAQPNNESIRIIARLKPNVRTADVAGGAQVIYRRWIDDTFSASMANRMSNVRVVVESAANGFAPERAASAPPLVVLMVGVALILVICCANAANVLLAQGAARRRELAMRRALGASQGRVVRHLLTESALLALVGGALGFALAHWGTAALAASFAVGSAGLVLDVHPDVRAGLMTYTTSRRTSEIGVRLALGGARSSILVMVLRESVGLVVIGLALAVPIALGGARLLSGLLYGVSGSDPVALAGAVSIVLVTAAVAAFIPAYRTSRVDPLVVLRHEG